MSGPGLARTYSMSVVGIEGHLVDVETYAGSGLVAFTLVGLLDTSGRAIVYGQPSSRVDWMCWTSASP